jgi:tetratricopeptide (TPR) repeat protein
MLAPALDRQALRVDRASHVTPAASPISLDGQAMLGQAMRSLRNDHNPAGALDILTRHAALFPQSPLTSERSVLEVEALLALGRRDEALLRLDRMSLDNTPRSAERYVVRGELRARAQRWSDAGVDFDQALAHGKGNPVWQERALWGRAATRTHTGDQAGARADLQIYLQLYPTGRFASEAERLLAAPR